jgi:two-component system, OmpR family, sensor kinase
VSPGSYTRSAARATFSAYRRLPIRWRLAGGSAVLTFVILASFAAILGVLTTRQVVGQFNDEVGSAGDQLQQELNRKLEFRGGVLVNCNRWVRLSDYASPEQAQIRIFDENTSELLCTQKDVKIRGAQSPLATATLREMPTQTHGTIAEDGYRVAVRELKPQPIGQLKLLYGRPLSDVDHTLARVRILLVLGVLGGTVLALLAGLWTAQRAMGPIAELTEAAREIERTRDPSRHLPAVQADDEIAELARTLEGMLGALDAARGETEAMLARQREFVADASHELRTPLTSVLANLELLAEELDGEQAESAQAALRSTRRMRRLVGDLLLLARADALREQPRRRVDLGEILTDAAAELGPMALDHELSIHADSAPVEGVEDDLHRLTLNLLENAVRHTTPGTHIEAWTGTDNGDAMLIVEDAGPGIPPEIERRVFERFVRGAGDGGRGSGLGLSIVRAVAELHDGTVSVERSHPVGGTRFTIRIPASAETVPAEDGSPVPAVAEPASQTSTTTGSTIGRRRSRS